MFNRIVNTNLNPGYNWGKFWKNQYIVIKFTIYAINFCTKKNPIKTFNYTSQIQSIYLTDRKKQQVLTLSRKKHGPDK